MLEVAEGCIHRFELRLLGHFESRGGTAGLRGAKTSDTSAAIASRRLRELANAVFVLYCFNRYLPTKLRRREHHQIVRVYVRAFL